MLQAGAPQVVCHDSVRAYVAKWHTTHHDVPLRTVLLGLYRGMRACHLVGQVGVDAGVAEAQHCLPITTPAPLRVLFGGKRGARHLVGQDGVDAGVAEARHDPAQALDLVLAHYAPDALRLHLHALPLGLALRPVLHRPVPNQAKHRQDR